MDITLLKTFIEVSKTRHFAKAADNLFVTPAAVSARVKLLESQLGVALFVRHRGNTQLTNEGERLLPLAELMINTWARTVQEVSLRPEMEARIHIGATSGMWMLSMQERLLDIMEKKPELAIQAEGHSNEDLARLLRDRTLDLVLLPDPPSETGFQVAKIGELTLVLVSNKQADMSEAMTNGYIYVNWGTTFANFHARKHGEKTISSLHVNLASIALSIIEAKGGAAYLPISTANSMKSLHRIESAPSFKRPIYACYQDGNIRLELIKEVVALLDGVSI